MKTIFTPALIEKGQPHEIAEELGVSRMTIYLRINSLKDKGVISRVGSNTKGYWKVLSW
ncbi:MAG: HTH domain-containing protein [Christensenellaceae bacterium]|nr:HTH domain-containing protein [Christensenellaceae bacterium]